MPAGSSGPVVLAFASNTPYRIGLFGGLALLPVLALLAFWPVRRPSVPASPPGRGGSDRSPAGLAVAAVGFVVSGVVGVVAVAAALGVRYALRARPVLSDRVTVGVTAGGLILAGAALSRYPWRSVDGYIGPRLAGSVAGAAVGGDACRVGGAARAPSNVTPLRSSARFFALVSRSARADVPNID